MHFKLLGLSLVTGMMSATAFAEPAIQPGETLESLSKVKVSTTVNGQAGSIEDLVASGQIRIVDAGQVATETAPAGAETELQSHAAADTNTSQAAPQTADLNTTAQNAESTQATPEADTQTAADTTAPEAVDANTIAPQPATASASEQANNPATAQTAQAASENADPMQPNPELAAQQAEQVVDQEMAAQAPVNETHANATSALMPESANAPANIPQSELNNEAVAAAPETAQPTDAVQAAPVTDATDAPVNASPEAPVADVTEN